MEILIWILISAGYLYFTIKYLDLAVTLFVCMVTLFSRGFVHLHFPGTPLYVTEMFLLFTFISIYIKIRKSTSFKWPEYKLKNPFIVLYLISVVSLVRGMIMCSDHVFVLRHAALFYYSIFYFILPIAYDNTAKIKRFIYSYIASCAIIEIACIFSVKFIGLATFGNVYMGILIVFLAAFFEAIRVKGKGWAFIFLTGLAIVYVVNAMSRAVWIAVIGAVIFALIAAIFEKRFRKVAGDILFKVIPISALFLSGYFFLNHQNLDLFMTKILSINPFIANHVHVQNPSIITGNKLEVPQNNNGLSNLMDRIGNTGKNKFNEMSEKSSTSVASVNTRWRLVCWKDIIKETLRKPILGWGLGKKFVPESIVKLGWGGSWDVDGFQDPHNSYLSVFHRTGLVGLTVFLAIIIYFVVVSIRFIHISLYNSNAFTAIAFMLMFVFICVLSIFMVVLEGPFLGIFCWLSMGFVQSLMNAEKKGEKIEG